MRTAIYPLFYPERDERTATDSLNFHLPLIGTLCPAETVSDRLCVESYGHEWPFGPSMEFDATSHLYNSGQMSKEMVLTHSCPLVARFFNPALSHDLTAGLWNRTENLEPIPFSFSDSWPGRASGGQNQPSHLFTSFDRFNRDWSVPSYDQHPQHQWSLGRQLQQTISVLNPSQITIFGYRQEGYGVIDI